MDMVVAVHMPLVDEVGLESMVVVAQLLTEIDK